MAATPFRQNKLTRVRVSYHLKMWPPFFQVGDFIRTVF